MSMKVPYTKNQEIPGVQLSSTHYPSVRTWLSHLTSLCPSSAEMGVIISKELKVLSVN